MSSRKLRDQGEMDDGHGQVQVQEQRMGIIGRPARCLWESDVTKSACKSWHNEWAAEICARVVQGLCKDGGIYPTAPARKCRRGGELELELELVWWDCVACGLSILSI